MQYPNASFFLTILHLECDPSFGPGSSRYRLTFDCPRSFSKYAGAGAAKSTLATSSINRSTNNFCPRRRRPSFCPPPPPAVVVFPMKKGTTTIVSFFRPPPKKGGPFVVWSSFSSLVVLQHKKRRRRRRPKSLFSSRALCVKDDRYKRTTTTHAVGQSLFLLSLAYFFLSLSSILFDRKKKKTKNWVCRLIIGFS